MKTPPVSGNQALARFPAPGEVRLVRLLPGPIGRVWDFIIDPEKRARWFCGGVWEQKAGGKAVFAMRHKNLAPGEAPPPEYAKVQDPGVTFEGRVLRCEPPRLLVFTFGGDDSIVTFDLKPEGDKVRLLLIHRATGDDLKEVGNFASGWHIHFAHLIALLEGAPRPPFWSEHVRLKALYCRMTSASPMAGALRADPEAVCDSCGVAGAFRFDGETLCVDCYSNRGSCCSSEFSGGPPSCEKPSQAEEPPADSSR